jgi:hypothetical protein
MRHLLVMLKTADAHQHYDDHEEEPEDGICLLIGEVRHEPSIMGTSLRIFFGEFARHVGYWRL